jgi:hypothetical protein
MVAFNFQRQFVDAIRSGAKTQTIRRNARCETGDTLQLYTGQRTKNCVLIGTAACAICEAVGVFPQVTRTTSRVSTASRLLRRCATGSANGTAFRLKGIASCGRVSTHRMPMR